MKVIKMIYPIKCVDCGGPIEEKDGFCWKEKKGIFYSQHEKCASIEYWKKQERKKKK